MIANSGRNPSSGNRKVWKITNPSAALTAPSTVRAPSVTTSTTHTGPRNETVSRGVAFWACNARSAPPSPAIPAEIANSVIRNTRALIPIEAAAGSLPRSAAIKRPVVPLRMRMTKIATTAKIAKTTRNHRSSWLAAKNLGRSIGSPESPPITASRRNTVLSIMRAKANVASDR
jgi:hypothetical protein